MGVNDLEKQEIKKDAGGWSVFSENIKDAMKSNLTWLSEGYWEVTNTSYNDVRLWQVEDFRRFVVDNRVAEKVFENLKNNWLKIYINDKTDVSYTHEYNIVMWMLDDVTDQSKYTMNLDRNASSYDVHKTKFIHEMCHSLRVLQADERLTVYSYCLSVRRANISITKLWDLDRYKLLEEKAREDTVELLRMYIQNPDKFKLYLWSVFHNKNTVEMFYELVRDCIDKVIWW